MWCCLSCLLKYVTPDNKLIWSIPCSEKYYLTGLDVAEATAKELGRPISYFDFTFGDRILHAKDELVAGDIVKVYWRQLTPCTIS